MSCCPGRQCPSSELQTRGGRTHVSDVHLDGRKAVVALRGAGAFLCDRPPVQVFDPATGRLLVSHGCAVRGKTCRRIQARWTTEYRRGSSTDACARQARWQGSIASASPPLGTQTLRSIG